MSIREILTSADPYQVLVTADRENRLAAIDPALAELRMNIPEGFHHKDNLTHSLLVLQNAIDRETDGVDIVLRTAALYHDVGKPATREFADGGVVSFTAHEHVGAHFLKKHLPQFGYSKNEIRQIVLLVSLHMRSYGYSDVSWGDSAVRRLLVDVNHDFTALKRLLVLFHSDITTRYPEKRTRLQNGIVRLEQHVLAVHTADQRATLRPALNGNDIMEIFGITPGRELGAVMKFLNSDENVGLSRDELLMLVTEKFFPVVS
jgi:poly(A) polymerase